MKRGTAVPLPLSDIQNRIATRITEAIEIAQDPDKLTSFPAWTQRVMLILKRQLVPKEFTSVISGGMSVFQEGVLCAFFGTIRDLAQHPEKKERQVTRKVMTQLASGKKQQRIAKQLASGAVLSSPSFQRHVLKRVFAKDSAERRAFVEGLALGCRALELFSRQAEQGQTSATSIYLVLWLYWPEIDRMNSVGEVGRSLGVIFQQNPNIAGDWDHRFRKIANRIRLSFHAKQIRKQS